MTATTLPQTTTATRTGLGPILMSAAAGALLLLAAGFAQSATLHDATHDVRHMTGFPCH
jgi:cobalt transporter subunit CbtB